MNEQQIADKLADIIDTQINKAVESLNVQIATLSQRNTDLSAEIETLNSKYEAISTESELRILEAFDAHKSDVNKGLEAFDTETAETISTNHKATMDSITFKLDDSFEKIRLDSVNRINSELIRLNDHVNTKLTSLKGEKGDTGEKGNEGDNGFLSGVSIWKTGHISKRDEAVTHNNSLWLCACEQTAQEPGIGDDYQLLNDGIKELTLDDQHHLCLVMGSNKEFDLGYVGFKFKGDYSDKETYDKNDLTALNGTTFISLCADNSNRPHSNTWKAFVKRGPKGSPGEKGEEGKAYNFDAEAFMDDVTAVIDTVVDKKIKVK